jgi:NADH-quinone oxidoreductase subunit F
MHSILSRICDGKGVEGDIELLESLSEYIIDSSLCQLGGTAPNSVLSTLKYFRQEYEEHIREKRCRASVCEGLVEAPCSHACPAGINAAQYVGLIAEGRPGEAVELIRRRNPFVSVCGRVCDAPCEKRCRRSDVDEPIAIRALKRYAFDNAGSIPGTPPPRVTGKRDVAIVGSGPAGLSCAYFLALMGRPSTVFEALPIAGGLLATGIPEYRLPRASLQADIDFILSHGVELRTDSRVDSINQLRADGYKAVFVSTGAPIDRRLGIEGEDLDGVQESLVFLRNHALGQPVKCGKRVAVIGGGNAAVDTARSALRLGAEEVTILYRRTRAEMPAYEEEIKAALEEGIKLVELVAPVRILGENGKVSGIEMIRSELGETDRSGRRRPVPIEGSEFVVACDTIVPAVGQAPTTELTDGVVDVAPWGGIRVDVLTGATSAPDVFAGGDCVSGGATVVEAIAEGQKAAVAIDRMLGGAGALPDNAGPIRKKPTEEELEQTLDQPRVAEPELPVDERIGSFNEVLCDLTTEAACGEAARCLRCDLERAEAREREAHKSEMSGAGVK